MTVALHFQRQTCRELLAAGFKVRAGARDVDTAKSNTEIAVQFGLLAPEQLSRLQWVEFDLEEPEGIAAAIGNASRVSGISRTTLAPSASVSRRLHSCSSNAAVPAEVQLLLMWVLGSGRGAVGSLGNSTTAQQPSAMN
jgi:uncharacterized protein YbjT (DUF2867 family)